MIPKTVNRSIKLWLWTGVIMVIFQIILGAITRLTGSGLSITKWDIVTGILFPINDQQWNHEFDLYKMTPQYQKINFGMSLSDFKFIFFWEYIHRLWARIIAIVFFIPLIYFSIKNLLSKALIRDLLVVFLLACIVASMGWIMVASGLINRPWVNAYKLCFHLCCAVILLAYLFWTTLKYQYNQYSRWERLSKTSFTIEGTCALIFIQIAFGGVMSGMKAAIVAPTWPDINGIWIPQELSLVFSDSISHVVRYEENHISSITIQFIHRMFAYLIYALVLGISIFYYLRKEVQVFIFYLFILGMLSIQIILGILTLINSVGSIPLFFGALHQLVGICTFLVALYVLFKLRIRER